MLKAALGLFILFIKPCLYSQHHQTTINAQLFTKKDLLAIHQTIVYQNKSNDTLKKIILRNWANSYKDDKTPLAKRLLEDHKTDFYFSKEKDRGYSNINSLKSKYQEITYQIPEQQKDLIFVKLSEHLKPKDSIAIDIDYHIKIPNAKFTGSGKKGVDYFLKDWYISPAQYHNKWKLDSHQNLNYQYNPPTDYRIDFKVPIGYKIYSNFHQQKISSNRFTHYRLKGSNFRNADLDIVFLKTYANVKTDDIEIVTDFISADLSLDLQKKKMQQMLLFLENQLGKISRKKILITEQNYKQHGIYELKYLPKALHPFKKEFIWESTFFKTLLDEYTNQHIIQNKNTTYWFTEGLNIYLFINYINQYHPNTKILGRLANVWGIKSMQIAKSKFVNKFDIIHQITARENLDQSLNTPLKELSNYNKKIITPYKSGLGFLFLEDFVGKKVFNQTIKQYAFNHINSVSHPDDFIKCLEKNSAKSLDWFKTEWLNTSKKIDHKIVKIIFNKDSIDIQLKNKKSIKTPVAVYGLKNDSIKSKTWVNGFSNRKNVTIKNNDIDKIVLNYEHIYPEINHRDNQKNKQFKWVNHPLKLKLFKDLNNTQKTQIFLNPEVSYGYYDGILLGFGIHNKAYIPKNFEFQVKPTYSTYNNNLTGRFKLNYSIFPKKTTLYRLNIGLSGSNYHYKRNLNYNSLSPYLSFSFKQKNFRALGTNKMTTRFLSIDKDIAQNNIRTDEDKYQLFELDYFYQNNQLIHNYQLNVGTEVARKFSKLTTDFRYKYLTNKKIPIQFRFFGGLFLNNNTSTDYFSFNQHTPNDYLFELPYLGRSETSGLFTQQYFKAQGGFVTQNGSGFANQWLTSINSSVGIWRWVELFNNTSLLKNKNTKAVFDYEGGIRLNFIPDILEFYLPVYHKKGWVVTQKNYVKTIRFSVTLKARHIIKFLKQQLF